MCGRYEISLADEEMLEIVRRIYNAEQVKAGEIRPTDRAPVLIAGESKPAAKLFRWGYDNPSGKGVLINARSETVTEKPIFRSDFCFRRCLIPASGFYEWSPAKDKYLFRRPDGRILYIGGFYRNDKGRDDFIILTKPSTPPVDRFHDRIPVLIDKQEADAWLNDRTFAAAYLARDYAAPLVYDEPPAAQLSFF